MTTDRRRSRRAAARLKAWGDQGLTRRAVLATAATTLGASACQPDLGAFWAANFQKHYQELSDEDKREVFARLEAECRRRYGVDARIEDPPPLSGVEFAYALNLSMCVGCRRCVYGCVRENNQSRSPQIHYIRVLEMTKGSMDVERSDSYYDHDTVPAPDRYYMPVQCHQCNDPPCVKVCPIGATWREPDGIVVVDYDWCIGCRYCEAACPYWARRFNFAEPVVPPNEINPRQGYLSNRLRSRGVMEKCTYCLHRTRKGLYPACVEVCPTGSRKFGNLLDPKSEVRQIIETKRVYVLREEAGTHPRFFYFFD